jgi:hypothetical protein
MLALATLTSGYFNEYYDTYVEEQFYMACDTPIEGNNITNGQKIESEYLKLVDRMMCSKICPCPPDVADIWQNLDEDKLLEYQRIDTN